MITAIGVAIVGQAPSSRGRRRSSGSDRVGESDRVLAAGSQVARSTSTICSPSPSATTQGRAPSVRAPGGRALIAVQQLERHAEPGGRRVELRSALQAAVGDVAERSCGVRAGGRRRRPAHRAACHRRRTRRRADRSAAFRQSGRQLVKDQIVTVPLTSLPTEEQRDAGGAVVGGDEGQALGAVVGRRAVEHPVGEVLLEHRRASGWSRRTPPPRRCARGRRRRSWRPSTLATSTPSGSGPLSSLRLSKVLLSLLALKASG